MKSELSCGDKTIYLYGTEQSGPLVMNHAVMGNGEDLWQACQKLGCPNFTLATISGLDWNDEMSPWPIPPISADDTPCSGGADAYLERLMGEILPKITAELPAAPTYYALTGYSLAGLFAVYAAYQSDCFSRIASASGSMWYPDFIPFVCQHSISENTNAIYFSLGDKESRTKNPYLAPVEKNTRFLAEHFSKQGIRTTFQLNKGNHFQNATERMASGIQWILQQ